MPRLLLILAISLGLSAEPRPIQEAEREAVGTAAAFLVEGAPAIYARLAPDAPLRALPRTDALRELAARTGPYQDATWTLQTVNGAPGDVAFHVTFPSGYDDGLLFRMQRTGARWSVREVLTLAERPAAHPQPRSSRRVVEARRNVFFVIAAAIVVVALLLRRVRIIAAVLLIFAAAMGFAAFVGSRAAPASPPSPRPPFVELRDLAFFREALARGEEPTIPATVSKDARDVATLWLLQSGAPTDVAGNAADPIASLGSIARSTQLAAVVRARIALSEDREEEAKRAFAAAAAMQPQRDDVIFEAASSIEAFDPAPRFSGSRDAALYYERARRAALANKLDDAQRALRTAWTLDPLPRAELVDEPALFALLHDEQAQAMVSLFAATEPAHRSASLARTPLTVSQHARSFASGEFLRIEIGNAALEVPGGAVLAPKNVQVVPATYWKQQEDARALRDAEELLAQPERSTSPAARTRVARAADALSHHNRWNDLLTLTNDLTAAAETISPQLLVLRLIALLRADRLDDARALANGEAVQGFLRRSQTYAATLLAIADAMSTEGSGDIATKLYRAARTPQNEAMVDARLRQLELRNALATSGQTITTAHFDIRHDATMNPAIAARIGDLLEAELARLQQKLSVGEPRRVVVNVLTWENFSRDVTGSDHIVGLYDGEILFPFAIVQQFKPEVVAIITHELTHALIAQATGDNAPRWFQEGVAQRTELVERQENTFAVNPPDSTLPLPLLDAVMENATDPYAADHGYRVAHTFIRFLEAQYGEEAIRTLIAEFAKGRNTDDALTALTAKSLDALNQEFRDWGTTNTAAFVSDERWPYAHLYSPGIDPRIKAGFKWGKRP